MNRAALPEKWTRIMEACALLTDENVGGLMRRSVQELHILLLREASCVLILSVVSLFTSSRSPGCRPNEAFIFLDILLACSGSSASFEAINVHRDSQSHTSMCCKTMTSVFDTTAI